MIHEDVQADTRIPKSPDAEELDPFRGVDFSQLERSLRRPRTFMSMLLSGLITAMTLFALIPLFSVVGLLLWRGGRKLSIAAFTQLPPAPLDQNGERGRWLHQLYVAVPDQPVIAEQRSEQQRSGFAGSARDGQHHSRQHPRDRRRQ